MKFIVDKGYQGDDSEKPHRKCKREKATYVDYREVKTLEEARERHWFDHWFKTGKNHREENGMVACDCELQTVWVIELNSMDELIEFSNDVDYFQMEDSDYKEIPKTINI